MNYYIITTDGNIYKCTCDFAKYPEAKIGELDTNGNMILNNTKASQWLCNFKTCTNDCFYSPICFKDACPSRRIFDNKTTDRCPIEKRNLSQILCILDKDSNLFQSLL